MICVPSGITAVEQRAVIDANLDKLELVMPIQLKNRLRQPIGADLPVWEPTGKDGR